MDVDEARGEFLTVDDVARFVASPSSLDYYAMCRHYGRDPGGEIEDDFLADQMRFGLMWRAQRESRPDPFEEKVAEHHERMARL